jgi:hypothetical protein
MSTVLYENGDHDPVTAENIRKAYDVIGSLTVGMKNISQALLKDSADDQYGQLQVIICCLERIEEEVFRITPDTLRAEEGEGTSATT